MKNFVRSILFILAASVAGVAFADPPPHAGPPTCPPGQPEGNGPPGKSAILHCGCTAQGDAMEYVSISVSSKSRGHDAHAAGSIDSCFNGVDTYTDFVRTGSDCQVDGDPLGDPIDACQGQVEFQSCGAAVID